MIFEVIIISIIYIIIKKKDYKNLLKIKIKKPYLFLLVIAFVLFLQILTTRDFGNISYFLVDNYYLFHIISLILIIICLIINYKIRGSLIVALGVFLNLLPIIFNKKMPVDINAIYKTGNEKIINILINNNSLSHGIFADPKLLFLTDKIYYNNHILMPKVISIGDIILSVGLVIIIIFSLEGGRDG